MCMYLCICMYLQTDFQKYVPNYIFTNNKVPISLSLTIKWFKCLQFGRGKGISKDISTSKEYLPSRDSKNLLV